MLFYIVLLLFTAKCSAKLDPETLDLLAPLKSLGEACGYESCNFIQEGMLNVHIVPHTHYEYGFHRTFYEHYTGYDEVYQKSAINMKRTLDAVITELWAREQRKFTFSDFPYFFHWWSQRDGTVRRMVYQLIRQGRLHFVGGGWGLPDETATSYHAIIESFTYSLRKLNESFLECGRPLVAWQVDAFGHSREFTSLAAQMGFDGLFINPISFDDEVARMRRQGLEFLWRGSDDLGSQSDIFTHKLYDGYWSPPGFCFSLQCNDSLLIEYDTNFNNIEERVDMFINSMLKRQAPNYNTSHVMVIMGKVLGYYDAPIWFGNIDKLIDVVNEKSYRTRKNVHLSYSTPACYLMAVHGENPPLETKQDDFIPIAYDPQTYLSGHFTSHPSLKLMAREALVYLQIAKQLQVFAKLQNSDKILEEFHWIFNLFQDHGIIAGALRPNVHAYYTQKLYIAVQKSTLLFKQAFNKLRDSPTISFYRCNFNISSCSNFNADTAFIVIYNPLSWPVTMPVRLPVQIANKQYTIYDPSYKEVTSALVKIHESVMNLPFRSPADYEIVFMATNLPPLGFKCYLFERINLVSKRATLIKNIRRRRHKKFLTRQNTSSEEVNLFQNLDVYEYPDYDDDDVSSTTHSNKPKLMLKTKDISRKNVVIYNRKMVPIAPTTPTRTPTRTPKTETVAKVIDKDATKILLEKLLKVKHESIVSTDTTVEDVKSTPSKLEFEDYNYEYEDHSTTTDFNIDDTTKASITNTRARGLTDIDFGEYYEDKEVTEQRKQTNTREFDIDTNTKASITNTRARGLKKLTNMDFGENFEDNVGTEQPEQTTTSEFEIDTSTKAPITNTRAKILSATTTAFDTKSSTKASMTNNRDRGHKKVTDIDFGEYYEDKEVIEPTEQTTTRELGIDTSPKASITDTRATGTTTTEFDTESSTKAFITATRPKGLKKVSDMNLSEGIKNKEVTERTEETTTTEIDIDTRTKASITNTIVRGLKKLTNMDFGEDFEDKEVLEQTTSRELDIDTNPKAFIPNTRARGLSTTTKEFDIKSSTEASITNTKARGLKKVTDVNLGKGIKYKEGTERPEQTTTTKSGIDTSTEAFIPNTRGRGTTITEFDTESSTKPSIFDMDFDEYLKDKEVEKNPYNDMEGIKYRADTTTSKTSETNSRGNHYSESSDLFISNKHIRVDLDPESRKVSQITLANGVNTSLDLQFFYYISDEPEAEEYTTTPRTAPGAFVMRPIDNKPNPILDYIDAHVYKTPVVQEYHSQYADWAAIVLRLYRDSPLLELEWAVGPVPVHDTYGKEVFLRYTTDLINDGTFYTDSNGRQSIKRIRNRRGMYEPDNQQDHVAGNLYPVTSKIAIEDLGKNRRFTVFNDRAQGGTSLGDGEIDLMLQRRILTDDMGFKGIVNETHKNEGIRIRGKHYIYLSKADFKPNKIFEKKFAKEIELAPQIMVSASNPYGESTKTLWFKMKNEITFLKRKLPIGVHILTIQMLEQGKLLLRLENYLEKDDVIAGGMKYVKLKDLFSNIRIIDAEETTLAANMWLKNFVPLQWRKRTSFYESFNKFYRNSLPPERKYAKDSPIEPLDEIDVSMDLELSPQQIRTFICTFEYQDTM